MSVWLLLMRPGLNSLWDQGSEPLQSPTQGRNICSLVSDFLIIVKLVALLDVNYENSMVSKTHLYLSKNKMKVLQSPTVPSFVFHIFMNRFAILVRSLILRISDWMWSVVWYCFCYHNNCLIQHSIFAAKLPGDLIAFDTN